MRAANGWIGGTLVGVLLAASLLSLVWLPADPLAIDLPARLLPPGDGHLLGTDELGRDVASRLLRAATGSATVAIATTVLALVIGGGLGLLAGWFRGWPDRVLMGLNDALLAFPSILFALALIVILGTGTGSLIVALTLAYAPAVVRLVRGSVLSVREKEYVEASTSIGNSAGYTMLRHVLPNCLAPLIVLGTSMFGWVLLTESALSFLGLGVPPPAPTWGNMLAGSRAFFDSAPWLGIAPGACVALAMLGTNLLGDALRDRFDPRSLRA
jgi:peptide/nickel transport system permease protein